VAQATPGGAGWQDDDCGQQAKSCVIEAWEAIPKKNLIIFADIFADKKTSIKFVSLQRSSTSSKSNQTKKWHS
jgi:hypothetical protein